MKVTLIYPGIIRIGFNSLGKGGMDCNWVNLGLAYLGAYLKKHSYDVTLIDLREMQGWEQVEDRIKQLDSDVYGVYFNTPNYNNALKCCEIVKKLGRVTVAGGPHASIAAENLIDTGWLDHVIVGEGEISFLELLDSMKRKSETKKIIQGKIITDLDELPFPDRDLYSMSKVTGPIGNFPFLDNGCILLTSRGCPFNCSFCQPLARNMFGKKVRTRSVENVIDEIKYVINKYKVKYISFQDDTFTAKKKWVIDLCKRIQEEKLDIQWSAQSRVDTFDDELAEIMHDSGCVCLFFGFENGSPRMLDILRKGIKPEQSLRASKICRKYGILMFADYMIGIPTEKEEDLMMTLSLIKKIKAEIASITYFTPIPGCDLYKFCKDNDLIKVQSYDHFTRNPDGEKIKGIDYNLLRKYYLKMSRLVPRWWQEGYYAKLAIKRWIHLFKLGYMKSILKELLVYTNPFR